MGQRFLNFAYGSNMESVRLQARTPSARALGRAWLDGHALRWHKVGADGSGKCDFVVTGNPGERLWGVLYEIDEAERHLLDKAEGLGTHYEHARVQVLTGSDSVQAIAYRAKQTRIDLQPQDWYHGYVVRGAREHGLPQDYLQRLCEVKVIVPGDPRWRPEHETGRTG